MFRGAFRKAMNTGVVIRLPLNMVAMIVTGALAEACLLVAHSENPEAATRDAQSVIEHLLEGLRNQ